jgi:hypothetical protein
MLKRSGAPHSPCLRALECLMKKLPVAALFLLAAAVTGCSSIESADLETSGINAAIEVRPRADGSATDVTASLTAGALTFVDLDGDDKLVASSGDVSADMEESNLLGAVNYAAVLNGINTPGDVVTVAFERGEGKEPAPSSTVRLPEQVTMTAPEASASFSRENDDIAVTLESNASDDPVRVSWSGECVQEGGLDVPADQATVTINKGTILKREQADGNDPDSQPIPDTCTIKLTASRRVTGTLDAAWGGGGITSVTSSSRDVTSNP